MSSCRATNAKGKDAARDAAVSVGGSVSHSLTSEGSDASEDGTGRGTPIIAFDTTQITHPENRCRPEPGVRRLTPRECERLQGFPDDYTLIPGSSDAARYKALGNSMAVPVMRWIGERISTFRSATRAT